MGAAVKVENLTKRYGEFVAVDGINLTIERGEIFGLLGPNGAGKTTTVEMIEGLRKPDGGEIHVCETDARKLPELIREMIGVQLQATSLYDKIRVCEAVDLFGGYYRKSVPTARLLDEVSLTDKANAFISALSGGQKQRLAMALALVNDPEVVFLDEPTTGLDPQARHNVWSIVEKLKTRGKTIILTTHYMEEAEHLCATVGIIDRGKIIALDSPANLVAGAGLETTIEFTSSISMNGHLASVPGITSATTPDNRQFVITTKQTSLVLKDLTRLCYEHGIELENISVRKATLEDVFLSITGRKLRE